MTIHSEVTHKKCWSSIVKLVYQRLHSMVKTAFPVHDFVEKNTKRLETWTFCALSVSFGKRLHDYGKRSFSLGKLKISTTPLSIANCQILYYHITIPIPWIYHVCVYIYIFISGWWFQTLWKIWVNWDDAIPNICKNMFQTTNHIYIYVYIIIYMYIYIYVIPWMSHIHQSHLPVETEDHQPGLFTVTGSSALRLANCSRLLWWKPWWFHGKTMGKP